MFPDCGHRVHARMSRRWSPTTRSPVIGERLHRLPVASPAGPDKIANFNVAGLAPHVAFFNLMAYDFHGMWENTTGRQAASGSWVSGEDLATIRARSRLTSEIIVGGDGVIGPLPLSEESTNKVLKRRSWAMNAWPSITLLSSLNLNCARRSLQVRPQGGIVDDPCVAPLRG